MARVCGALAVVTVLLLVSGCSGHSDRGLILDALAGARSGADAVYPARSVAEHLPNQTFTVSGEAWQASDYVVVGTVSDARVGASYAIDGDATVELEPGSTSASWSMANVEIAVEEAWGDGLDDVPAVIIQVPLRGPGTTGDQLASIRGLGRIVAVVDDGRIVRNEGLLGLVDASGRITWVVLEAEEGEGFAAGIDSVSELREAARADRPPVALNADGSRS